MLNNPCPRKCGLTAGCPSCQPVPGGMTLSNFSTPNPKPREEAPTDRNAAMAFVRRRFSGRSVVSLQDLELWVGQAFDWGKSQA